MSLHIYLTYVQTHWSLPCSLISTEIAFTGPYTLVKGKIIFLHLCTKYGFNKLETYTLVYLVNIIKMYHGCEMWMNNASQGSLFDIMGFSIISFSKMIDQIFQSASSQNVWIFFSSMTFNFTILK